MSRYAMAGLAMFAALALAGPVSDASAETIIRKTTTYFSIGGRTAEDIDREMLKRGPLAKSTGRRHPGATQIKFSGSATFVGKSGRCHIGNAKVALNTKLLLPRWSNRRKAGKELALIWDTLAADIKRHEERHAEIARNHARDLERAILALAPARDCAKLKARVNDISQAAMVAHEADQQRFDRIESANFENRMIRLLKYRLAKKRAD